MVPCHQTGARVTFVVVSWIALEQMVDFQLFVDHIL